ncbi:MAG: chemotaxis protein CheA [Proteobacteria bacterium]|nr:chemotaxis protein CheA [Pseudomonadota bacterium]
MEKDNGTLSERELEEQRNVNAFKEEAYERLAELEEAMLELENSPDDPELIDSAFRSMHTIKGSGGMFGFDEIVRFTHDIETVYDHVRDGKISVTEELIALSLKAHDQIGKMLEDHGQSLSEDTQKREEITVGFRRLLPEIDIRLDKEQEEDFPSFETGENDVTYRIRFIPSKEIFTYGTDPVLLLNELSELGECHVVSLIDKIPLLKDIDPESCYTGWNIILTTNQGKNAIDDVFIFIDDESQVTIDVVDTEVELDSEGDSKKIGEILVDRGDIDRDDLENFMKNQEPIGKKLTEAGLIDPGQIQSALEEQKLVKKIQESRRRKETVSSIRVASGKLDKLVDLVGELVTGQARLTQIANNSNDMTLLSISEEIERLTAELRDNTMGVRMLNFGTTFNKFKRLVRDLSHELGAEVVLTTEGEETELDKNVIEQLNDPLVHIIRNSVDHGIEPPDVRMAADKPREGRIHLAAAYAGAHVLIKISDDGAGLDADVIRKKAVDKGIIAPETTLTERETYFQIFEPGFSTAETVTNVSGRGVGMDVVKKAIEALRGSVDIDSQKGVGTTITLKLPLTLAIIDGLLVMVGEEYFVIPLAAVEECIELTPDDISRTHGRHITNVRDQIIPYIRLREQFNVVGRSPEIEQVVITEIEKQRVGFVVDQVMGQHQTVIKNLSKIYKDVETISGATIMADGTVALILDVNKHLHLVEKDDSEKYSRV